MAYGVKYIFRFWSVNGQDTSILVREEGFTGAPLERAVGGHPTLRMESSDGICGMSLEIPAQCDVEDEYADLYTSDPYKFLVELAMGGDTVWRGFITPELYAAPWVDPPYDVSLTATDGLGELKMRTFPALGRQSLEALLSTALGLTGLTLPLKLISSAETDLASPSSLLAGTSVNLDDMAGKTWYDVVAGILVSLHATLRQYNGAWVIIRETDVNVSINTDGDVEDLSGATYPVTPFGSQRTNAVWPVGRLSMEIRPAKSEVRVTAPNRFPESLLANPDMDQAPYVGWTGGSQYDADGGFRALNKAQSMWQDWFPPVPASKNYLDLSLKIKARSAGSGSSISVMVQAYGADKATGNATVLYLSRTQQGSQQGTVFAWKWVAASSRYQANIDGAQAGDSSDCRDIEVPVPILDLVTNLLSSLTKLRVTLTCVGNTVYVHRCALEVTAIYDGVETALLLGNEARGAAPAVETVIADSFAGNKGVPLLDNAAMGVSGGSTTEVKTWGSDIMPQLPYGEFLAKDMALSVAVPRLRLQGKLNIPSGIPSPFLKTKGMVFLAGEWSLDLLEDEADIDLLSLPAASVQVTAVRQTAFNGEGERSSLAASVTPSSFIIGAADTSTTFYMAIDVPAGTGWQVENIPDWLTFSDGEGIGPDTVSFTASANSGAERTAVLIVAGVAVSVTQQGLGTDYPLIIIYTPSDASLSVLVDGSAVVYQEGGIPVGAGASVTVTLAKTGLTTITDTFTMPQARTEKTYSMVPAVDATIAYPSTFTSAAQEVAFVISDPSNHGWVFDYGGLYLFLASNGWRATGSGVTSCNGDGATGRGDAVVYLTFKANSSSQPRSFNVTPLGYKDNTTGEVTQISLTQLGSSGVLTQVTSVTIPAEKTLTLGQTYQLEATVLPAAADNKTLTWESSDPSKVAVDQTGRITARAVGSATITARATDGSGCQDTCYVTVQADPIAVRGVSLDTASVVLAVGAARTLHASIDPSNATDQTVSWQVLNNRTDIATVSQSGVVTAVAPGTCVVRVTTRDGSKTADCEVTVTSAGTLSVESVTAKSSQTSASAEVTAARINPSSIQVSESASWITGASADTSGGVWYIRLTLAANTSTASRSATVTVNATDTNGDAVGPVTFTVTQNGKTSSDVPCSGMAIAGADTINNSGNSAVYGVDYSPSGCTQNACVWSLVSGDSYASIETLSDGRLRVTVKPGASGNTVRIKAVNYYNGNIEAVKDITVTYISSSAIEVSPASVTVHHDATSDNTPVVDATGVTGLSVQSVSGFITSASIQNGRVVTVFGANTGGSSRAGSVTLQGFDGGGNAVTAVVGYTQAGVPATGNNIAVTALKVEQVGGKVRATVRAAFHNGGLNQKVFGSVGFTLTGKDSSDNVVFTRSESLSDKTVAAMSTETEIYEETWTGTVGMSVEYDLTFTAGGLTATYTGDGDDII